MTTRKKDRPFVKAADTTVAAEKSRAEIEKMLIRYGASGFAYQRDLEQQRVTVQFVIPDRPGKDAPRVPITLPVDIHRIYDALYGRPERWDHTLKTSVHNPKGYDEKKLAQAERVAWRNLVLWIDAALSAATIGVQTITEAFLAHTMVVTDEGGSQRMMDYLTGRQGVLAPGARALLPPPRSEP